MVGEIKISPTAAKDDGCMASPNVIQEETYPDMSDDPHISHSYWFALYRFTAQAAGSWRFSHWELTYSHVDTSRNDPTPEVRNIKGYHNPWSSENTYESEESWVYEEPYVPTVRTEKRTITNLVAVFEAVPGSGRILHSAASGMILHGASGILHDA